MKVKTLALLMMSAILVTACNTTLVEDTSEDIEVDVEVEAEVEADVGLTSNFGDFSQSEYDAAIAGGKTVFLDFHADWCPTCLINEPEIDEAFGELNDDSIVGFKVNYDNSASLQKEFGVTSQSTLVLISGGDVSSFTTLGPGVVSADSVLEFLQS